MWGEDVADPKGGVFGVTRGLADAFSGRVFNAPLAEASYRRSSRRHGNRRLQADYRNAVRRLPVARGSTAVAGRNCHRSIAQSGRVAMARRCSAEWQSEDTSKVVPGTGPAWSPSLLTSRAGMLLFRVTPRMPKDSSRQQLALRIQWSFWNTKASTGKCRQSRSNPIRITHCRLAAGASYAKALTSQSSPGARRSITRLNSPGR